MTTGPSYPPPGRRPVAHGNKKLTCEHGHLAYPTEAKGLFRCKYNHWVQDKPKKDPD